VILHACYSAWEGIYSLLIIRPIGTDWNLQSDFQRVYMKLKMNLEHMRVLFGLFHNFGHNIYIFCVSSRVLFSAWLSKSRPNLRCVGRVSENQISVQIAKKRVFFFFFFFFFF
jgi:hypothetical protein